MKKIAIYNIKGGVGKTAAAVNLAYLAAEQGARTLLWDLDPQGASSFYFRVTPKIKGGSKSLIRRKRKIDNLIKGSDFENLDLIPADFSYRYMDLLLDQMKKPTLQFHQILKPLSEDYDVLFLDCPPSMTLVSENVLQFSEVMLVPVIPTPLSLRTFNQLFQFCVDHRLNHLKIFPFFSMVDRRKKLHREVIEQFPRTYPDTLNSRIPYSSDVEKMGLLREVVVRFAPRKRAAQAFSELWKEINLLGL